jgi:hypothetical protein
MTKREAINKLKELVQIAGPDRLRALFGKYNLKANLNVSGVITGVELYGRPFFADFAKMVADAQRAQVRYNDYGIPEGPTSSADDAPTGGGFNWDSLFGWLNTFANTGANIYGTISGNNNGSSTSAPTGTNTPIIIAQPNSNSGSNTALWVIGGVVALILVVVVIFLAMKK